MQIYNWRKIPKILNKSVRKMQGKFVKNFNQKYEWKISGKLEFNKNYVNFLENSIWKFVLKFNENQKLCKILNINI